MLKLAVFNFFICVGRLERRRVGDFEFLLLRFDLFQFKAFFIRVLDGNVPGILEERRLIVLFQFWVCEHGFIFFLQGGLDKRLVDSEGRRLIEESKSLAFNVRNTFGKYFRVDSNSRCSGQPTFTMI